MLLILAAAARRRRRHIAVLTLAALAVFAAAGPAIGPQLEQYLADWYASIPGTRIAVTTTREVSVPGFSAWRLERKVDNPAAAARAESGLALADESRAEIFLGEVLHDPDRLAAKKPFEAGRDLPNVRASLQEMLGLPARVELSPAAGARGVLLPMTVQLRQDENAWSSMPGFVSSDGATVLLGEFRPMAEPIVDWRRKLLAARPGVRADAGAWAVTEFLDFQCERCKRRTPEARRAAASHGGTVESRFLPLVKQHEWSFAAAECAAALAGAGVSGPSLYRRYEEAVFGRFESMSAASAREVAADLAESAGAKAAFESELSSGRARERVLRDLELATRLGIHGTPTFVLDGRIVPGERGYLENALFVLHGKGSKGESGDRVIR